MDERIHDEREVKKLLRQAGTLAHWSVVGLIFPLAAWILGGIAISKVRGVREDYLEDSKPLANKYRARAFHIKNVATMMIVLSLIVSVLFSVYVYTSIQASIQAQQAQKNAVCAAGWVVTYNEMKQAGQTDGHSLAWYTSGACNDPATPPPN
jgi:hypothetical protein